jgi:NADH:ubiquinone oxidoreductase subunit 4 (subunit M)
MFSLILVSCLGVFYRRTFLGLYFFYEASLVPIIFVLVKCGRYPDRMARGVSMFSYTSLFSFPLIVYVVWSVYVIGSFSFVLPDPVW